MNKAFVKESGNDDTVVPLPEMPAGVRNYITPAGYRRLQQEWQQLHDERDADGGPAQAEREQRMHYLQSRLDTAEVVDPGIHEDGGRIFFGAHVRYEDEAGQAHEVHIVGLDEIDPAHGRVSWLSPVAQALLGSEEGDSVTLEGPDSEEELTVLRVQYPRQDG